MDITAHLNNLRISPRKVRLVADMIRGISVPAARAQLSFLPKRSALPILKLLNSAAANAQHNAQLNPDTLYVARIFVNEGVTLKRGMPKSHGRVFGIKKRSSHISLTLSEKGGTKSVSSLKEKRVLSRDTLSLAQEASAPEKKKNETAVKGVSDGSAAPQEKFASGAKKRLTGLARRAFTKHSEKP